MILAGKLFAEIAEFDRTLWEKTIGRTTVHHSIGDGTIISLTFRENNSVSIMIKFDNKSDPIPFNHNSFLNGVFTYISIPDAIEAKIEEYKITLNKQNKIPKFDRKSICWNCHRLIETRRDGECPSCRWIPCQVCGACKYAYDPIMEMKYISCEAGKKRMSEIQKDSDSDIPFDCMDGLSF